MMSDIAFDDEPQTTAPPKSSAEDFFSTGSPSCRFNNIGDAHQGVIVEMEEAQQRDIKTGQPKNWPDGNPCMMLIVTLQTDERDDEIDDDDGKRRLYVNKPSGMFAAIKQAVGKEKFVAGGKLAIKYTGNGKPKQAGFSAPKEYIAKYVPVGTNGHAGQSAPKVGPLAKGWTYDQAIAYCVDAGITKPELVAALKAAGETGWNFERGTAIASKMIADKKLATSPFETEQVFKEEDIPF